MTTVTTRATAASVRAGIAGNPDGGDGGPPGGPGGDQGPEGNDPQGNAPQDNAPAAVVPFALVPAQAIPGVLDFSRAESVKAFQSATKSLYSDSSELFNCDLEGLYDFLQLAEQRSLTAGFRPIFQVPHREIPTAAPVALDYLGNYGVITLQEVQADAASYVNTETRKAQDSVMLYHMLLNSLSLAGRAKVTVKSHLYMINGVPAGVPFLKVIIDESGIETHATVSSIRTQLANLDAYMPTVDSDIKKFNIHVRTLVIALNKHRQESSDLLIHLFKGYKAAKDNEFAQFIKRKEESYEEGAELSPNDLMRLAEEKYKILTSRGEWKASAESDKRILALEAKIKGLEKKGKTTKGNANKNAKGGAKDPPQGKDKKREIADWIKVTPKHGDENKPKVVDGKEYWWCTALKRWCIHKPVDCRALNNKGKDKKFTGKNDQKKKLKFAKALKAIEGQDHESDSE